MSFISRFIGEYGTVMLYAVITAVAGFLLVPAGLNAVLYLFLLAVFNLLLSALWLAWLCKKGCRILGTI